MTTSLAPIGWRTCSRRPGAAERAQRGDPAVGLGRPARLGHNLTGFRSRRLRQKDRFIYRYDDDRIYVFAIGGHYDDR